MNTACRNIAIAIQIVVIGAITLAGCVPLPPLTSTPKLALYYQEKSPPPSSNLGAIKRWLPDNGTNQVLLRQPRVSTLGPYVFDQVQPHGSSFMFHRSGASLSSSYLSVPDSSDPTPRLLNMFETPDEFDGGPWISWAPDGQHIGMRVGRSLVVTAADGSERKTIDTLDNFASQFSWSPDGSKLAYTKASDLMKVFDIDTGEIISFSAPVPDLNMYYDPQWMADNRHIVMDLREDIEDRTFIFDIEDPTSTPEKKLAAAGCWISKFWSAQHDRLIQSQICENYENHFQLIFMDNRPNVPLTTAPLNDYASFRDYSPTWSQDGEKFSYVHDADGDGNADIVIANKDGVTLQTFSNIGVPNIAAIGWAPDNTKLFVVTTGDESDAEKVHGATITLSTAVVGPSFTLTGNPDFSAARIDWSPDSQHVVFRVETYDEDTGYLVNAPGLLIDTENADASPTPLFVEGVLWSPDSNYLATRTLNPSQDLEEDRSYRLAVIAVKEGSGNAVVLAENADGGIEWSNPRAEK